MAHPVLAPAVSALTRALPAATPPRGWNAAVNLAGCLCGVVAIGGLLIVFHQVVLAAVQKSESGHQSRALQAEEIWNCNTLSTKQAGKDCLLKLASSRPAH